jgi:hypothetical protein
VDNLFHSSLETNLIVEDWVGKLGLDTHGHPFPYPLGWVNKDVRLKVTK